MANPATAATATAATPAKRERKPKKPSTVIGTLNKISNMLEGHSEPERARILGFLNETNK